MKHLRRLAVIAASVAMIVAFGAADDCSGTSSDEGPPKGWSKVHPGDYDYQVRQVLGKPNDKQHFESGGEFGSKSECWYYGGPGQYQICFDENGRVDSKNDY